MTARSSLPHRRGVRTVAFGGLVAACLAFGVAACSSGATGDQADQATPSTPLVVSVPAPLNAIPTSGQDPADATDPGAGAPAEPLTTGTPTQTQMTALTDLPDPAPVSTAGPIAPAGNIDQIVPEVPVTTAPAVALTDTADFGGQVTARISQVSAVQATATRPGEVSGPAVAVTVEIANGSGAPIGVDAVTVTLTDAGGNPATSISTTPAAPLQGVLDAGTTKSGTYVFTVPADQRNPVTVTVNYSSGAPTLVFTGQVAGG
jgi:hypothetical protein